MCRLLPILLPALALAQMLPTIRPQSIRAHLEYLADDALEGRRTGTRGHELAALYVRAWFLSLGLTGGVKDSRFFQPVALRRTEVDPTATSLRIAGTRLRYNRDFILFDTHAHETGALSAPVVFAGYGVTAPEFHYDDYAGLDVKGKIVAVLFFEAPPSFPPTERAFYMDPEVKHETAREHGAAGIIDIATPELDAKFPWEFILREVKIGFDSMRWLDSPNHVDGLDDQIKAAIYLNRSGAEALFGGESHSLAEVFASAKAGKPRSFPLKKTVRVEYKSKHTPVNSVNVVGVLPGSDAALRNEFVVVTAHSDHLGLGPQIKGDAIYNGALDNAAGSAIMLEVARCLAAAPTAARRSIAFVSLTGEEEFLLGSRAFAAHLPLPGPVVANINVDGGAFVVPIQDVVAFGEEHSSLGNIARRAATELGLEISADRQPEEGHFIRSDQYSFVRAGVPALQLDLGYKSGQPGVDVLAEMKKWQTTIYHSPQDDTSQTIDYETSARFARFVALITRYTADSGERPHWKPGDFFAKRFCKVGSLLCP